MNERQDGRVPVFESPCTVPLDEMPAFDGGRRRFCSECTRSVHMLSEHTREEAQAFLREHGASACVSYRRGPDGRVQFKAQQPPTRPLVPVGALRRRPRRRAAAVPVLGVLAACAPHEDPERIDDPPTQLERDLEDRYGTSTERLVLPEAQPQPEEPPLDFVKFSEDSVFGLIPEQGDPGHYMGGFVDTPLQFEESTGAWVDPDAEFELRLDEPIKR